MRGAGRRGAGGAWLRRALVLLGFAAAGVVAGRLLVLVLDDPPTAPLALQQDPDGGAPAARDVPTSPPAGATRRAAEVLRAWDAARASAYARGEAGALGRLYLEGSRAGARDVRTLRAYAARGLVVRGLRTQLLSLRVLTASGARLRVEVTERRVGGSAVGTAPGRPVRAVLPQDAPTTRVLELRRTGERWQVASVTGT